MDFINNTQADILEHLGRFKFLGTSQITKLVGKSLSYTREQIASLSNRKFIKSYSMDKPSKAENIYFLSETGKEILLENNKVFPEDIKVPIGVPLVIRDYSHRKNFIDIHIALYNHLQQTGIIIETFYSYFDKTGNNRSAANLESKTKLDLGNNEFFMPDGIMVTNNQDNKEIYLLEMYNGRDTIRTLQQLAKHTKVISLGTTAKKFNIPKNPIILCVFEFDAIKEAVIKRLLANDKFKPMNTFFYFASLEDLGKNFEGAWSTIHAKKLAFI